MHPIISFIIPCYRLPIQMLRQCIESILALSLSDEEREIILVDDGSDPSPLFHLKDFQDQLIYIRQRNGGVSLARNRGIELSSGQYIQFVDGDDMLIRPAYEHCIDIIRYEKDVDILLFRNTSKESTAQPSYQDEPAVSGAFYMRNNNLRGSACGYLFKRQLLGTLRFTVGQKVAEDDEFTAQLILRAEKLISTDAVAYWYRCRADSVLHGKDKRSTITRLDDTERAILKLYRIADRLPIDERTALERKVHQLTMDYIYNIIRLTHSETQLEKRIERLEKLGLFPLPDRSYTRKYSLFRLMTKYDLSRKMLLTLSRFKS